MNPGDKKSGETEIKRILHQRAQALSRPEAKEKSDTVKYLLIDLGDEEYAIHVDAIVEVVKDIRIVRVPGAPRMIEGVANLRGEILSVINLARAIGLPDQASPSRDPRIIRARVEDTDVGILADGVSGITEFTQDVIEPPLVTMQKTDVEHLEGEIKDGNRLIGIIDLKNILRIKDNA